MNTATTPVLLSNDIEDILGINDMSPQEATAFFTRVGEMIIESATLKYVVTLTEGERFAFQQWLGIRQANENLLQLSCEIHPAFAEILTEEMQMFQSETKRLFGVST